MRKVLLLVILIFTVIGCAEIQEMDRNRRERGDKCVLDPRGNMICGYTR